MKVYDNKALMDLLNVKDRYLKNSEIMAILAIQLKEKSIGILRQM